VHILFVDESGNPPPPGKISPKYFVLGGVIIPEEIWPKLSNDLRRLKKDYAVKGEIKWRYFIAGNKKAENSLLHLEPKKRDELRLKLLRTLTSYKSIKIISVITDIKRSYEDGTILDDVELYYRAHKTLTERFQYFLQDLQRESGQHINGLIVCDQRSKHQDSRLRDLHQKLINAEAAVASKYKNLIEGLFLAPSHYSVGIQFADLVAGSIFRRFEANDERFYEIIKSHIRTSCVGKIEGYGLIHVPKKVSGL
jgi:hypothetical protein